MTGGGAAQVAFAPEPSPFEDLPADPTYIRPGRNITVEEASLSNALERMRVPDEAESVESIAGRVEGAFSVSWAMSADRIGDVQPIIFNDSGTGFVPGQAATSKWFLGLDYLTGTAERALVGVTPQEYTLEWNAEDNTVTESLTAVYQDEELNTSITPTSIQGAGTGETVPFHGASLDLNTVAQTKLQSFSLTISDIARFQWGADRNALDAVINAPKASVDLEAIFTETDQLKSALGGSSATTTQDSIDEVSAVIGLSEGGSTATEYTISAGKPDQYDWNALVEADPDTTESVQLQGNGVEVTV